MERDSAQVDSAPVLSELKELKDIKPAPPVVKKLAVATSSAALQEKSTIKIARPEKQPPQPPVPVVDKLQSVKPIERTVTPLQESRSTNQSTGKGTDAVSTQLEKNNTAVALTNISTIISANTATSASQGFKDALPRYDLNPHPVYPEVSRRRGQQGTVLLQVAVLADGSVENVLVTQSSGYKILDRTALKAVRRWRFQPATSAGQAVASRVVVPVDFVLQDEN